MHAPAAVIAVLIGRALLSASAHADPPRRWSPYSGESLTLGRGPDPVYESDEGDFTQVEPPSRSNAVVYVTSEPVSPGLWATGVWPYRYGHPSWVINPRGPRPWEIGPRGPRPWRIGP
jgi:hypothetical protein